MQTLRKLLSALAVMLVFSVSDMTADSYDVFVPITKYIAAGDAESLSAWFADNLEVSIFTRTIDSSKNQATQVLKFFFRNHRPRSFTIGHTASGPNSKYALGNLIAGGEVFQVTIFVSRCGPTYKIQQLKIDRMG